jgi:2-polyprenyl-3-methyl-5-hydroxy-6-metoxy-1,4-benzoquinol methylase
MMAQLSVAAALRALTDETQRIWESKAAFWDEQMGEGNAFQLVLVGPASERLLQIHSGEHVLDVACGNSVFSRRLAQLGVQVMAVEV